MLSHQFQVAARYQSSQLTTGVKEQDYNVFNFLAGK